MVRRRTIVLRALWGAPVVALLAMIIMIMTPRANAVENAFAINAPRGSVAVWIDVESNEAQQIGVGGKVGNNGTSKKIEFKPSPSGVTAVTGITEGAVEFSFGARGVGDDNESMQKNAILALTFVDKNDAILAESTTPLSLEQDVVPVKPNEPSSPSNSNGSISGNNANASGVGSNSSNEGEGAEVANGADGSHASTMTRIASTGSVIAMMIAIMSVFVLVGLSLIHARPNAKGDK